MRGRRGSRVENPGSWNCLLVGDLVISGVLGDEGLSAGFFDSTAFIVIVMKGYYWSNEMFILSRVFFFLTFIMFNRLENGSYDGFNVDFIYMRSYRLFLHLQRQSSQHFKEESHRTIRTCDK